MNSNPLNKNAIALNFSRAARHYDTWACAQADIAESLVRRLPATSFPRHIVDLGCGTGLLTARLLERFPFAELHGIDIADGMIAVCRARWAGRSGLQFTTADAEDTCWSSLRTDLVACSCSAQWFNEPEDTLRLWVGTLRPGGRIACALLLRGSFPELEAAHRESTTAPFEGLRLPDEGLVPPMMTAAGLDVECRETGEIKVWYPSASEALHSFRRIGAVFTGQPGHQSLHTDSLRRLLAAYGRFSDASGRAPVTYHMQYLIAERAR